MENLELVKPEQEGPSVDTDTRNAHNSVDYNISNNRSSPSSNPNGVSSVSGKVGPSVILEEVGLPASVVQDAQRNGDSEILKNCETRWLQLFRLVEKQCQEQIVAQQKVFYHQIHRIQNQIRRLVKLQNQNVCSCAQRGSSIRLSDSFSSLESQMGLKSELFEENELFNSQFKPNNAENQAEASVMHQEGLAHSVSVSSGYGTLSAAELSPSKCNDIQTCMENTETITKQEDGPAPEDLVAAGVQNKRECPQTVERCPPLKENDRDFPAQLGHKISESQRGDPNCKPLTSWAQKLKQNQVKKTNMEEEGVPGKEPTVDNANPVAAAAPSPSPFYLSQQNGSQNSLVSLSSGLTYWKLDEKEMYQTLPRNLGNEFPVFSTKASSEQLSSSNELKPTSLKDIYHKKQQEDKELIDWNFSPLHSTHPPEILTLDPTLHMKPGEPNAGLHLHRFYDSPDRVSFSPDSMADPAASLLSDADSFSHVSTVVSPRSAEFPKYASHPAALNVDSWGSCEFQNEANVTSSPHLSNEILDVEDEDTLTLTPSSAARCLVPSADHSLARHDLSVACVEDPVVLSKIRQNLREKHTRHIADLRAYYESEILSLKQKLEASQTSPSEDMKKISQNLTDRCDKLEAALHEANSHVRFLENKNNALEMEVTDWQERFCAINNTTKSLQERIEEMRMSSKDKDNTISRLKRRLKDLEEAFEKAYKLSDNKDARLKEENKMFQNLLGEYESLGKEHERVKDSLNITENKLLDAHTQISDLKRTVSKLETQVKQLEHENLLRFRHLAEGHVGPSYASKLVSSDVSRRKWLIPGSEFSIFTGQPLEAQESPNDNRLEKGFSSRHHSPPEKDSSPDCLLTNEAIKKDIRTQEIPILKAFKEFEERKALKNRGTQAEKEEEEPAETSKAAVRRPVVGFDETSLGTSRSPEKSKEQPRHKKFNSPSTQRSSSLPPSNRKINTPTKREIMLTPVAVTYSPKRSPKENLSPGFSHFLSRNEDTMTRFDIFLDDAATAPVSALQYSNPRKRLQFCSGCDTEGLQPSHPENNRGSKSSSYSESLHSGAKRDSAREVCEAGSSATPSETGLSSAAPAPYEAELKSVSRIKTLAETERLFDELTQEKQQLESQLSRIPCAGGRMTLQARLNQEALEDRLERVNRELGSIRMILKRFHILRTSANI
ncbi:M-phase phosphoprotein 9 [Liasis olivaceus]